MAMQIEQLGGLLPNRWLIARIPIKFVNKRNDGKRHSHLGKEKPWGGKVSQFRSMKILQGTKKTSIFCLSHDHQGKLTININGQPHPFLSNRYACYSFYIKPCCLLISLFLENYLFIIYVNNVSHIFNRIEKTSGNISLILEELINDTTLALERIQISLNLLSWVVIKIAVL